jgi:hypothetical protein
MRDIFVIGAQKAGTTFLHNLIAADRRVASPPVKEPHYFSSTLYSGRDWEDLFDPKPDSIARIDSSASYLHIDGVADRIYAARGSSPLILAVLRDPLERAISSYFHAVKHGREVRIAADALMITHTDYESVRAAEEKAIRSSLSRRTSVKRSGDPARHDDDVYADPLFAFRYCASSFFGDQLAPFIARFEQVRVIDFPRLVRAPDQVLARIYDLIGEAPQSRLEETPETNQTKVRPIAVLRRYFANLSATMGSVPATLFGAAAVPRILNLDYDSKRVKANLPSLPWVAPARAQYEALIKRAL